MQTKTLPIKYKFNDVFKTVKKIIDERYDGVDVKKINNKTSFKHDLNMDSLDTIEILMECEKSFGREYNERDTNLLQHINSIGDFCKIQTKILNNLDSPADVLEMLKRHFYINYDIPFANGTTNWYKDLGLTNIELQDFYLLLKNELNIEIKNPFFKNLNELSNEIFLQLIRQSPANNWLYRSIQKIKQRSK